MAYLEELLPEFRKGAKIRKKDWADGAYLVFNTKDELIIDQKGRLCEFIHGDVVSDEWELYQESDPDWNYIIKNKCMCWFWNDDETAIGILKCKYTDGFLADCGKIWENCRPVRRDEVTFYEDKKDQEKRNE